MNNSLSPLNVFRNRSFLMFWSAALSSNFGALMQAVGALWLMTSLTSSQSMVALVQASVAAPIMVLSMLAGMFADNFNRRRVILTAQMFMLAVSILLTKLAFMDALARWTLLAFTFLVGCGTALHNPSWQASMGDIVGKADLPSAVSLNSMGMNITRSGGPAAGGAIVALAGAAAAFAANALSYLAIIFALWRWRPVAPDRRLPPEPFGAAYAGGLRYVALSPNLLRVILRGIVSGFSANTIQALLPIIVRDTLGASAFVWRSAGLLRRRRRLRGAPEREVSLPLRERADCPGRLSRVRGEQPRRGGEPECCLERRHVDAGGRMLGAGALNVQHHGPALVPRWVIGCVVAIYQTGTFGGMAIGSWVWGTVAEAATSRVALMTAAAVLLIGALIGLRLPLPAFGMLDLDLANRFREPLRLDIKRRSGPIMVMVDCLSCSRAPNDDVCGYRSACRSQRIRR